MPKYIPTTTTTKKRGPKPKKPRSIIGSCAEAASEPKRPFVMKITFNPTPTWKMTDEEVEMYIANGQTVDVWIDQWAFLSPSKHVGHDDDEVCLELRSVDLYKDYSDYCENKIMCQPETANSFGRQMHDRLHFESKRKAQGVFYRVYCDKDNRFNENNM